MILDKNRVYDGWDSLAAGMDAGRRPSLIEDNQCAIARDVVFRGGVPKSRPGIKKIQMLFEASVFYSPSGQFIGPTIPNCDYVDVELFSNDANFTDADIGSRVVGINIPNNTTIISLVSATFAVLSQPVTLATLHSSVTIIGRTNPSVVTGTSFTAPNEIFSTTANFTQADLGHPILSPNLSAGTTITSVVSDEIILVSSTLLTTANVNITLPDRANNLSTVNAIANEPFQCASYYTPPGVKECIMATLGGRLFQITPGVDTARVREIQLDARNRKTIPENWMVQADRFHITQDGEAKPIIFDGVSARRAAADEVIVGQIMAYGIGRLIVTRGRDIFFGDLFGSHTGDPSDSVLKFTETSFLNEGFPAEIPYTSGDITAMSFFPSQDTATGQGELVVFTDKGAVSFDLHLPRDQWKSTSFQQIALLNTTARGSRAVVMVNADLWIRSDEGWRDYRQARSQANGWYQLPQSTEVSLWMNADTPSLLRYGSAINFNNRLIATCNPVPNSGRLYHDGIVSLDFDVLSSFGQATRPAWDGHWGKLKTLQLVSGTFSGQHRAFAFGLDENNETQLYEITADGRQDFDGPITSEIEFRSHNFGSPFNEKQLYGADIWVDDTGPGSLSLELSFRSDSSPIYLPWKTIGNIVPPGVCGEITCGMCPTIGVGFSPRIKIPKPKDDCDDYSGRMTRRGFEFQPKLRWTGHAAIRRMRLHAMQEEEDSKAEC